jgi:hypothetical protein
MPSNPTIPDPLEQFFADGTLIRPDPRHKPDLVHLARALAVLGGVHDLEIASPTRKLIDLVGPADHLIFVLLDGLGMNTFRELPPTSFLTNHLRAQLHSTCPSTTACALTSIDTADWPCRHGITVWLTRLPDRDLTAMILPFAERGTSKPLALRGIKAEDVFPLPPILPRLTRSALTLSPAYIANTVYNVYCRGGTLGLGYNRIADAVDQTIAHISNSTGATYTYLYIPDVDTLCHHVGVEHEAVMPLVLSIDAELARLRESLDDRAKIIVTADHGLIDVPTPDQTLLHAGDPLLECLHNPPTGDARMPIFHLRPDRGHDFLDQFHSRFGDRFLLLSTEEAGQLELFGPCPLSPLARARFGDFIGIPFKPATLSYHPPEKPVGHLYLAVHAGLSPQEMIVPLCVA